MTARVDSEWNPWSDTYELAVAPPNERSLFLERRNLTRDVRELIDLKPDDRLRHHVGRAGATFRRRARLIRIG